MTVLIRGIQSFIRDILGQCLENESFIKQISLQMGLGLEILMFSHEGLEATYTVVEDNRWPHNTLM